MSVTPLHVGWVMLSVTPLSPADANGVSGLARVRAAYYVTGKRLPTRTVTALVPVDDVDTWDPEAHWRKP